MKKKLIALSLASMIGMGSMVGGTYAYFSDTETSAGNTFSAGTLNMTSFRDDIPIEGPMFYTGDSLGGAMGTGLWKPGDSHTRGIYIENTGSLNGKLKRLYAAPDAVQGTEDYSNAMEFADQSTVVISMYENTSGIVDATAWSLLLKETDTFYKNEYDNWLNNYRAQRNGMTLEELKLDDMKLDAYMKERLLNKIFVTNNASGQNVVFRVKQVYSDSLKHLVNPGSNVAAEFQKVVKPNETMYLGYTVAMEDLTPEKNNQLQGKEVKFSFAHEFVQE